MACRHLREQAIDSLRIVSTLRTLDRAELSSYGSFSLNTIPLFTKGTVSNSH